MTTFTPTTAAEVLDAVRWAVGEEQPLEIVGRGTKRGIGRPAQTEHAVDLSRLTGVTLYEPEELVLSARAGTPLAEVEALLAARGQEFAFEPMDYAPLLTGKASSNGKSGTVGGALAANLSGPRRLKAGAARDHILGTHAVSGRGEAFKAGGRVVKNVTGYDLSKAMAGSWGTLAVVTDLTFKVLPRAETETTVVLRRLDDEKAVAAMAAAMGSSAEVSGAAHLPELVAARVAGGMLGSDPATLLRVDGFGPSVAYRVIMLSELFGGHVETVDAERSRALWAGIRDVAPFADGADRPVWRISLAPSEGWKLVAALRMQAAVDAFYDWQGGLVWLRLEDDPEAELVRRLVRRLGGGHATLVRAAAPIRAAVPVFEPQPGPLGALSARVKSEFDPKGILNPGRMATV
ncbi:FAD-binding protein [Mesorhizobium sp. J428]|uniref:FAD-binding protein n=1 Tax=Mesorhizobium sp. J428 TaxID=2898440 RepID=UPI0021509E74|nr:FAD-binding protein [Mesorhizobium sp. J428]MCR5858497.1 FAD-binding protein [Mesorhizobium sp. J428]